MIKFPPKFIGGGKKVCGCVGDVFAIKMLLRSFTLIAGGSSGQLKGVPFIKNNCNCIWRYGFISRTFNLYYKKRNARLS
jgi:hypothetical protein